MTQDWKKALQKLYLNIHWHRMVTSFDLEKEFKPIIVEVESLLKEEREKVTQELVVNIDIELRRILADELPKLEEKIRQEERLAILEEVERQVEEEYGDEHPKAQAITRKDILTIIKSLRV